MRGINVALPLTSNLEDGSYALVKNFKDNTRQNLKTLILTSPGERLMIPDYGVGIRRKLFQLNNRVTKFEISRDITKQVSKYMPHVEIIEVNIFDSETNPNLFSDDETIQISIVYRINVIVESATDRLDLIIQQ